MLVFFMKTKKKINFLQILHLSLKKESFKQCKFNHNPGVLKAVKAVKHWKCLKSILPSVTTSIQTLWVHNLGKYCALAKSCLILMRQYLSKRDKRHITKMKRRLWPEHAPQTGSTHSCAKQMSTFCKATRHKKHNRNVSCILFTFFFLFL